MTRYVDHVVAAWMPSGAAAPNVDAARGPTSYCVGGGRSWKAAFTNRARSLRASLWERPSGDLDLVIETQDAAQDGARVQVIWEPDTDTGADTICHEATLTWSSPLHACWAELPLGHLERRRHRVALWLLARPTTPVAAAAQPAVSVAAAAQAAHPERRKCGRKHAGRGSHGREMSRRARIPRTTGKRTAGYTRGPVR